MRSLSLTHSQLDVYLAALELGQASMQDLSRKSGVKRTTIYKFIDELKTRGFITETRRNTRKVYGAVSPEKVLAQEKGRLSELEGLLPQLQAVHNAALHKPRVMFYEGLEVVKGVYLDSLQLGQPILAWSDLSATRSALGELLENEGYPEERARRNIELKWIVPDTEEARQFTKRDYGLLRETKFLSGANFKMDINIYGNKVMLVNAHANTPFAVVIEDNDVAETLRAVWQQIWDRV